MNIKIPRQQTKKWTLSPDKSENKVEAVIYCEGGLGNTEGKTANGLIHHSKTYNINSVIDSTNSGIDSGEMLFGFRNEIPIVDTLSMALSLKESKPRVLIFGLAPATGRLAERDRLVISEAISKGLHIVCGLHEFISDDPIFVEEARRHNVTLRDVRKPKASHCLRSFDGSIAHVRSKRIVVAGTDCAVGKRTTAILLERALNSQGIKTVFVSTGQTGVMQGTKYGVVMDSLPSQFAVGELEGCINQVFEDEFPEVILIEGQGALGHPAFSTSAAILRGSQPHGVIIQHAPNRYHLCDFPKLRASLLVDEIKMIESFIDTQIIGITINHEGMTESQIDSTIEVYGEIFDVPVCDPLRCSEDTLANLAIDYFDELESRPLH